ncbi:hypothetical protein EB796_000818 [Bugula neritina]|uniref:Uncharacterized protein n=1 Tax=Bugula neritina TaxID=10212 RepID=A0A7J7KRQ6_BUGNE|nr:hypothetical protein EB796_000818 [Bugula neritina]
MAEHSILDMTIEELNCSLSQQPANSYTINSRSVKSIKSSHLRIEIQKSELAFTWYASCNKEIRAVDKLMSSLETDNITLERLTQACDQLELHDRVITDDYVKLNMLSEMQ